MTDFSSLLIKNIDLILEAYNLDDAGNLVVANSKKVREADEVFHQYFVKSMNQMFRQLNEADPIMQQPNSMGLPQHGVDNLGLGDEMMPDMGMMGMAHGHEGGDDPLGLGGEMGDPMGDQMGDPMGQQRHAGMGGGSMGAMSGGGMGGGGMSGGMGESADYNWLNEDPDLDINSLFDIKEEEDEEEDEHEKLDEFMMGHQDDEMMGGSMDHMGGANDMGGDMGGMGGDDGMDLDSGMDHHGMMGGGDEMGDDGDMVTIHGTTDNGADFEFSFDPNTLGFDDLEGGGDMGGGADFGGHEEHGHEGGEEHHGGDMDHTDEPGFGSEEDEEPVAEAMVKKGKPGKGRGGPRTARMAVVPSNPAVGHAAPFPTPQGVRQKRK